MSEVQNDGGPAFPRPETLSEDIYVSTAAQDGMSLRDWFAGQALSGILAGGFADTIPHDDVNGGGDAAFFAYQYANAMIKERAK